MESPKISQNSRDKALQELQRLRLRLQEEEHRPLLQKLLSVKEEREQKDEEGVRKLRAALKEEGLLPPELDEYHALLRYSRTHEACTQHFCTMAVE